MFSYIWHTFFFDPIYNTLVFFIDVAPRGDVGLAIVCTVVVVKTILLPLSVRAAKTQKTMKEIEPKLREIKENHKDDRQQQAQAMMSVYKEAQISPFASIILIFLQIPIVFALYFAEPKYEPPKPPTITAPASGRIKSILNVSACLAITPAKEFTQTNSVPAATASFSLPNPNMIISGTRYTPPPIPTEPATNPKTAPSPKMRIHFGIPDNRKENLRSLNA